MEAGHGPDCGAPPATHHVSSLADSAFICKNHMMTAIYGGGDAGTSYGAVYFAPAQLVDFSSGEASVSWQVSTLRPSTRDWWDVWITPFEQNLVVPVDTDLPAYQGVPKTALHVIMQNGLCNVGQPATLGVTNGSPMGTTFQVDLIQNFQATRLPNQDSCVEDNVAASAANRSLFQLDVSSNHVRFSMPGTSSVWVNDSLQLPFNQGVVQLSHHSYNPDKGCSLHPCPGTFHWSNFAISQALPFTMLRPEQPLSLHEGRNPTLQLPQPAPANAFLRFIAIGQIQVSFDGAKSFQPAQQQAQPKHSPEGFASYWTPVPAGTTSIAFKAQPPNGVNLPYWIEDVSVWSRSAPGSAPPSQAPPPTTAPTPTPPTIQSPGPTATPAPAHSPNPAPSQPPVRSPNPTPTPTTTPPETPESSTEGASFRSASVGRNGVVNRPANAAKGDLMLAVLEINRDATNVHAPAGWTLVQDTPVTRHLRHPFHALLYARLATANEPSQYRFGAPDWTWNTIQILDYKRVNASNPIGAVAGRDAGWTARPASPSLTATEPDDLLVLVFIDPRYGRWTPPEGMTRRTDLYGTSVVDQTIQSAGPTGTRTATTSRPGSIAVLGVLLRPA
jgi:hypothetical protein